MILTDWLIDFANTRQLAFREQNAADAAIEKATAGQGAGKFVRELAETSAH